MKKANDNDSGHKSPDALAAAIKQTAKSEKGLPPVHLWNPPLLGDLDMRIARNGHWFYQNSLITRPQLVKLFSTILRYDDDGCHYLVTPVEKWRIEVEDAPFVAVLVDAKGAGEQQVLRFSTNVGEQVEAGIKNRIRVGLDPVTAEPKPYIHIRSGLEALISRNVFYDLVNLAQEHQVHGKTVLGVWSGGEFFSLE